MAQASAGELIVALRRAADAAPDKPGFWANVGDAFGHAASGLGHVLTDVGVGTLKTLASLGTAMTEHPEDLVAAAAGIALMAASAGGALGGGALTLTGAGAVVGVPVSAVSVAGVAVGATMVLAAAGDLANHAAGDDRVQSDAAKGDAERAGPPPDGARMPVDEVMEAGQRWLGPGYGEPVPGSGRYVSSDGLRVFRIGESDITGKHGGGPHANFERLEPNPAKPGRLRVVENRHIYLTDP